MSKVSSTASAFDLSQLIQQKALELGFQSVGILPATVLTQEYDRLQDWLTRHYQASMGWMKEHGTFRRDPGAILPGAKSIVCVAIHYNPPEASFSQPFKIARYAQGKDYHKTIRRKLKKLLSALQAIDPTIEGRAFCDSAPLLEKALAVRAGLGWLGKNGLVIDPKRGSWLFLGELLLSCELVDEKVAPSVAPALDSGHCGRCTRCLEACPTQAIVSPAVVDANRCIAYWTIENHDEQLPDWFVPKLEGWAFGCDICQEVCPWNLKFATPTVEPDFWPRPELMALTAQDWLSMTPEAFEKRVTNNPMRRTGLRRLQRNIRAIVSRADAGTGRQPLY